ncbi:hypothetical protein LIER_38553 [Lithospermum erythrorhizon]|uniref:Uncharacterized protein n=1 Tax=Lithospermum erythrorhizon TaxID=34254 RepID=A0AAV3Q358_LITER
MGILNQLCAVRPPKKPEDAMPDEATISAMNPFDRICANNTLYKNLLPVPPGLSTKKTPPVFVIAELNMISKAFFYSAFKRLMACKSSSGIGIFFSAAISLVYCSISVAM